MYDITKTVLIIVSIIFGAIIGVGLGFDAGQVKANEATFQKCVDKYSDMPHNQVMPFCKSLMEFKK